MVPRLLHIYGPFFIQSYGLCIALGILIFNWLLLKDKKRIRFIDDEQYHIVLILGIFSAIVGGRLLFFLTSVGSLSFYEFFQVWNGGFAVLGAIIAILIVIPLYLRYYAIPVLPLLDRAALYTPLLQSISRIGCFLSGCCYGKPTLSFLSIIYNDKACMAPLGIALHPTQLYSSCLLAMIFLLLFVMQRHLKKDGQLVGVYLFLIGLERFFLDFLRNDQTYSFGFMPCLSDQQYVALGVVGLSLMLLVVISVRETSAKIRA